MSVEQGRKTKHTRTHTQTPRRHYTRIKIIKTKEGIKATNGSPPKQKDLFFVCLFFYLSPPVALGLFLFVVLFLFISTFCVTPHHAKNDMARSCVAGECRLPFR